MGQSQATTGEAAPAAFEEILARLNTVVEKLESGDLTLEDSLALFEEGVRLTRLGAARLDDAERRVERLLSEDGTTVAMSETRQVDLRVSAHDQSKENEAP
jgi:exodeoxyribonuclease VII small subunit